MLKDVGRFDRVSYPFHPLGRHTLPQVCGKVQFRVSGPFDAFHLCHCSQCRRSTGTAHAANIFTSEDRLEWLAGEDLVKRYIPEREGVISKAFCTHCGSLVPYTSLKSGISFGGSYFTDGEGNSIIRGGLKLMMPSNLLDSEYSNSTDDWQTLGVRLSSRSP